MLVNLHIDWTAGNCYICAADRGNPPLQGADAESAAF